MKNKTNKQKNEKEREITLTISCICYLLLDLVLYQHLSNSTCIPAYHRNHTTNAKSRRLNVFFLFLGNISFTEPSCRRLQIIPTSLQKLCCRYIYPREQVSLCLFYLVFTHHIYSAANKRQQKCYSSANQPIPSPSPKSRNHTGSVK